MKIRSGFRMEVVVVLALLVNFLTSLKAFSQEELIIDSFKYASEKEAQSVWVPLESSLPVSLVKEKEKKVVKLDLNFPEVEKRCYWDRVVALDLSNYEKIILELKVEDPSNLGSCTLYFQSTGGWFGCGFSIDGEGWQKIVLQKSQFKIEQSPSGWDDIIGIRISFWKPSKPDVRKTALFLGGLKAKSLTSKISIVFGDTTIKKGSPEAGSVSRFFNDMVSIFEGIGIDYNSINESVLEKGIELKDCEVLIFPHNPDMTDKEVESVEKFVGNGGKILVFYSIPDRIAKLIGIESAVWRKTNYDGEFDAVRFDTKTIEGLPEGMKQGSWNAKIPAGVSGNVRIIGEWIDAGGKSTGATAATLSDNGFCFGHVLLNMREGRQMIFSVLANLLPKLKPLICKTIIENSGRISGFENFSEAKEFIEKKAKELPQEKAKDVLKFLGSASDNFNKLNKLSNLGDLFKFAKTVETNLKEAFCRVFKSRSKEFRGVWCHSAFGIPGWTWDQAIDHLKKNNFNTIVPNMLWAGLAYYPSEVLPVAVEVNTKGDQIAQCLSACKKYGIECHIWKVNWNLVNAPKEFIEKLRNEGRLQSDKSGKEVLWLCPSHPENFKLELLSMLEVVKKYDIDGIHFDYIRYPDGNSCYCKGCKERFENEKGVKVENWPQDVISGTFKQLFGDWRGDQITKLVKTVSEEARKTKPSVKISAAVFRDYPSCRDTVGQDWKAWVESGYLDFVCPMDYINSNYQFERLVKSQNEIVKRKIPLYPGIKAYILPLEQVITQVELSRDLGADGFIVFNYDSVVVEYLPFLREGVTEMPSESPHRK